MWAFFKGWRRKAGGLTLMLACVTTGMWLRSLVCADFLRLGPDTASNQFLASFQASIKWIKAVAPVGNPYGSPSYRVSITERYKATDESLMPIFGGIGELKWHWQWDHFGFLIGTGNVGGHEFSMVLIPYWSVAIPLTLLSAYLILWKPRLKENRDA